jgi:antitoxin component YwqK of YwqJK toxin-antitoxin module
MILICTTSEGQIILIDTTWSSGFNEELNVNLDTCTWEMVSYPTSEFKDLESSYGTVRIKKYGMYHYLWNNDISEDTFLIPDGKTLCYYENGRLGAEIIYQKGIILEELNYNTEGKVISSITLDTVSGIRTENYYKNNVLQEKREYVRNDSIFRTEWYPENNVKISKGKIEAYFDLSKENIYEEKLTLSARDSSTEIRLLFEEGILVKIGRQELDSGEYIILTVDSSVILNLEIAHDGQTLINQNTLKILDGSEKIVIPIQSKGAHISYSTLDSSESIVVNSQITNRILIDHIGTETSVQVYTHDNELYR